MSVRESEFIAWATDGMAGRLPVGPGDDAAVLEDGTVLAVDAVVEGVHFTSDTPAEAVVRKALGRPLSDLCAMGADAQAVFVAALLPPSVLYCEVSGPAGTLRAKYAVISRRDFLRRAGPRSLDTRVWARFCQPAALVHARDEGARDAVVEAVARACRTFVERMTLVLAAEAEHRFDAATLWQEGFHETYRAELRGESPQTVRMLYESAPARYEGVARDVLQELDGRGRIRLRQAEDGSLRVVVPPGVRRWARASWALRRRVAKSIAILGLLKTAWTFGDWVPYVLWKIERHTGVRLEVSERQRRHPLIFGWPVIYRVLRRGLLR